MTKALRVARWEFTTTITRRAYVFAVIAMPLFYGGMVVLSALAGRSGSASVGPLPIAVIDRAEIVDLASAVSNSEERPAGARLMNPLVAYDSLDRALTALQARRIAAVFVIERDYVKTGSLTAYRRNSGIFAEATERRREGQLAETIRRGLLGRVVSGEILDRAAAPMAEIKRLRVDDRGRTEAIGQSAGLLGPFAGAFGVSMSLSMAIFFSAGFLQQAAVEDRQNRMIEILLSSVDPTELLAGKILGLTGAGLLQVGIYVGLVILPGATLLTLFEAPASRLALSVAYFGLGYLLYACLMAGIGMVGRTSQENAQLSAMWTLASASPLFFLVNIGTSPNGVLARIFSFVPMTSPVTMLLRLANRDVPVWDIVGSIAIDLLGIVTAFVAASKLFRIAALMYGQRATLPELIRWLRVA
jgi:ABC-2 type transport system permease protein